MTDSNNISGMTVNERLAHLGLFQAFDTAVAQRDMQAMLEVLRQAHLSESQAQETAATILANTGR